MTTPKSETINKRGMVLHSLLGNREDCRGVWVECSQFSPNPVTLTVHGHDGVPRTATIIPGGSELVYVKGGIRHALVIPATGTFAFIRHMVMRHTDQAESARRTA